MGKSNYGSRLLPVTIDQIAADQPDRAWASVPRTDFDLSQGYTDITYQAFAKAINEIACLIEKHFGRSTDFQTIAYLGVPDVRYYILQMAAAKTGYKILFSSHNNSLTGHLALMEMTECTALLSALNVEVRDILNVRPMRLLIIPELEDLLDRNTIVEHYPYSKTFDEAVNDPYLILHTSGSTGSPKVFVFRHGGIAAMDRQRSLSDLDPVSGVRRRFTVTHPGSGCRFFCPFLPFHAGCSVAMMCATVFSGATLVPGFRHKAVTTDDLFDILDHSDVDGAILSPAMLEKLAVNPEGPEYLKRMSFIFTGGAALTEATGKLISTYCELQSQYGSTENLNGVDLYNDPNDFGYNSWDVVHSGAEFRPVNGEGDLHELILHRTPESYPYISYFHNCSDESVFRSGDLWRPHPNPRKAPHTWKYAGRNDDLILYKDGGSFHPIAYELKHSEHSLVRNVVICGTGHAQPVLIIELQDPGIPEDEKPAMLKRLWEESTKLVNEVAPKNGQIASTHVIIARSEKPFERSVKGTVARKPTIKKYEEEIEEVYRRYGDTVVAMSGRN